MQSTPMYQFSPRRNSTKLARVDEKQNQKSNFLLIANHKPLISKGGIERGGKHFLKLFLFDFYLIVKYFIQSIKKNQHDPPLVDKL